MGMDEAASNVGSENGCWIIWLAFLTGGFHVMLAALIEGKHKGEMSE